MIIMIMMIMIIMIMIMIMMIMMAKKIKMALLHQPPILILDEPTVTEADHDHDDLGGNLLGIQDNDDDDSDGKEDNHL